MIELTKIQIIIIAIVVAAFFGLTAYIIYDNVSDEVKVLKTKQIEDENQKLRLELKKIIVSRDLTISELKDTLNRAKSIPPKKIVSYAEKIIYSSVTPDTIISSFSNETTRYRAKRKW